MDKFPPTAEELQAYLAMHYPDSTRTEIADLIGVTTRALDYWRSGKVKMSYPAWFTLKTKTEGLTCLK